MTQAVTEVWSDLFSTLLGNLDMPQSMRGYFALVKAKGVMDGTIYLEVPNDLTRSQIEQRGRKYLLEAIATSRQIAMYLCREKTNLSLPKIGQLFGGRDHTTVMYAHRKITKLMTEDRSIFNQVTELTARIQQPGTH